jgi:hypothetical protein
MNINTFLGFTTIHIRSTPLAINATCIGDAWNGINNATSFTFIQSSGRLKRILMSLFHVFEEVLKPLLEDCLDIQYKVPIGIDI